MNSAKFRRKQNTMIVCGWGVLILGIWSVLRFILSVSMEFQTFVETYILPILDENSVDMKSFITVFTIVFTLFLSLIDVLIRFLVCRGACAQGRGKPKNGFYVVLMVILILFAILSIIGSIEEFYSKTEYMLEEVFANLLMSVTDFVITVDLLVATISVRRAMKRERMKETVQTEELTVNPQNGK